MWLFYVFAGLLLCQGLLSLRGGIKYYSLVREAMGAAPDRETDFQPFASVIVPCRGIDQGFLENVGTLFAQRYTAYEIIFVSDSPDDLGLSAAKSLFEDVGSKTSIRCRFVVAGKATDSGQKVHNLRAAAREISAASQVLVFVDTDARAGVDWLRSLVAPLKSEGIGASTGYRWFIPEKGGLASHLLSVWNASIVSTLGINGARNFCWGGSTAILTSTFNRLDVLKRWKGTLSDDFTLTTLLHEAKLPIQFVPGCLTPSFQDSTFKQLLEFTTRQIKITRVYATPLWKNVLIGSILFVSVFFGGIALVITRVLQGRQFLGALLLLAGIFALGAAKSLIRWRAVKLALRGYGGERSRGLAAQSLLWPIAAAIYLYNSISAAFSRRIEWRGITYELKSPTETVIIPTD